MSCMWPRRSMALVAMLLMQSSFSAASWCQADVGSCIGELHAFEEHACGGPMIEGSWRGKGFSGNGITHQHLFRFADWDGDGDMDLIVGHYMNTSDPWDKLQIEFHERLPSGALQAKPWHTVESTPEVKAESFEVVDWDGDQKMDLLLCIRDESRSGSTRVFWYNHSVLETEGTSPTGSVIVSVDRSTPCDLRAVDFDEDGDVDLFVGQEKYFERVTPTKLVERTENPLAMFDGQLVQLVDIDGDGHLDVIQRGQRELLFFRRSLDGRFIEPLDNPLTGIIRNLVRSVNIKASDTRMDHILRLEGFYHRIVHVADWDSDGLPDLFQIEFGHDDPNRWGLRWECQKYYRHVVNRDLKYNSHFTSYEDIETSGGDARSLQLIDWNKDGWDDVMVQPNQYSDSIYLYEVNEKKTQKVSGVLDKVKSFTPYDDSLVLLDWDADGNMDLIATSKDRLVFYQMVSGKFQANPDHPLSQFRLTVEESDRRIVPVDWDQDGDMDLFVIQIWNEKRQYFEQQHDGSVKERSIEFGAPFESLMLSDAWVQSLGWHFLDCDGDGDMDLVRSRKHGSADYYLRLQACEHKEDGSLHCDDDFRCLGTDFSLWNPSAFAGFGMAVAIGVGSEDGRLKILAAHQSQRHPVLWTAGFCKPSDSCNQKGTCIARQVNCECNPGYESKDCSRCEPQYYTASLDGRHMRSCEECPGEVGGQVCYGRGRCFDDDVAAKAVTEAGDYTATLTATGNGSCLCSEADFYGVDEDGRTTCVDGFCPAGTEERDGGCYPCDEGSSSLAGLPCTKCPLGTYSEAGNSSCLECPPGTISDSEGASACDACLAGKYEVKRQSCADCTVGTFSFAGDGSCTKCSAGTVAPKQGGSTCAPCPRGKYSQEGSARCDPCPRGTVSESGSGNCSACDAGRFSQDLLTCEPCPGGTFAPRGSPKCQQCSQGKYSGIGSESCRDCPPGTISNSQGASECVRCPPGRGEFNRQACIDCPVGTISFGGNGSCTKCSAGTVAPKQGGSTCDRCPEGTYSEEAAAKCTPCDPGTVASAASGNCSECTAGRFSKDLTTCEQCPAGKYASLRSFQCTGCPSNHVAKPGSGKCESCESRIIRSTPDATKQSCQPESMDLILAVISAIASSCFCFLCLLGFHGRIALADISAQGEKNVITTVKSHFLMKSWCPQVTFAGTGVPT